MDQPEFIEMHNLAGIDRQRSPMALSAILGAFKRSHIYAVQEANGTYGLWDDTAKFFLSRGNTLRCMKECNWWPIDAAERGANDKGSK